jgi:Na+/H+ antiporter NhaD/arsenite permease-like protein
VSFIVLRRSFASSLATADDVAPISGQPWCKLDGSQLSMLVLLLTVLGSYPIVASIDGSAIWLVSAAGAALAVLLVCRAGKTGLRNLVVTGVNWEILVFLPAVFMLAIGLRNVGVVDALVRDLHQRGYWTDRRDGRDRIGHAQ